MKEGTLVQVHNNEALDDCRSISKPWSSSLYEDLACTLLRGLPPSFHTLVVSLSTCTNQLSMELICGK
jgi:hypothetical protein